MTRIKERSRSHLIIIIVIIIIIFFLHSPPLSLSLSHAIYVRHNFQTLEHFSAWSATSDGLVLLALKNWPRPTSHLRIWPRFRPKWPQTRRHSSFQPRFSPENRSFHRQTQARDSETRQMRQRRSHPKEIAPFRFRQDQELPPELPQEAYFHQRQVGEGDFPGRRGGDFPRADYLQRGSQPETGG